MPMLDDITPEWAWTMRGRPMTFVRMTTGDFIDFDRDGDIWVREAVADDFLRRVGSQCIAYLPPAHRRQLAEAIGAGDFAEHPEAWETSRFGLDDASRFAYCLKHSDGDGGLSVVEYRRVSVAEPPSSWSYWIGQCQECGVIYWHRGEERRDDMEGLVDRAVEDLLGRHNAQMVRDLAGLTADDPVPLRGGDFTAADLDRLVRGDP